MGSRQYSDPTYGGHHTVSFITDDILTATNASEAAVGAVKFMFPCQVISANITAVSTCEDLTTATGWVLSHRLAGATGCTAFGTADLLGATAAWAPGAFIDDFTQTGAGGLPMTFASGDECVLELEGTSEVAGVFQVNLEVVENFVESDT